MSYFSFINKAFDQYPCRRSKSKYIDCLNFILFCFNPTSLLHIVFCISNVLFMSVNIHSLYLSPALSIHPSATHQLIIWWGRLPHGEVIVCGGSCCHLYLCTGVCVRVCVRECICLCLYLLGFVLFILKIRTSI